MLLLSLQGIHKRFGSVQALRGASFALEAGEVHALLGENGAGKSTLMHIAYGLVRPDAGAIHVRGKPVVIRSPRDARALGLGMVHQHFTSVGALTVGENIALAGGRLEPGVLRDQIGRGLDVSARVEDLPVGRKQQLEIVKAMAGGADILLLDEPTSVLAPAEVDELLTAIRGFARAGGAVALITHKLGEVFAAADRVTVLRHGVVTLEGPIARETRETVARAMIGEAVVPALPPSQAAVGRSAAEPVITLTEVSVRPIGGRGPGLRGVSLEVRSGELVSVAGIEGNGQRELFLLLAGLVDAASGAVSVATPATLVPEDRTTEGLIASFSLVENLVLGAGVSGPWRRGPWIDWSEARRRTAELLPAFDIRVPGPDVPAGALSGGNQQKFVLARALEQHPRVILAENPTRGLDLRATVAVHDRLRRAARDGVAVVVYSSDLDEVLDLGTRVVVVAGGKLTEMAAGAGRDEVGKAMLGMGDGR
jgi:simple sugar transport system ATP-binding protein